MAQAPGAGDMERKGERNAPAAQHGSPAAAPMTEQRSATGASERREIGNDTGKTPDHAAKPGEPASGRSAAEGEKNMAPGKGAGEHVGKPGEPASGRSAAEGDKNAAPGKAMHENPAKAGEPGGPAHNVQQKPSEQSGRSAAEPSGAMTGKKLDQSQEMKIQETIHNQRVEREPNVDFSVSIGAIVPPHHHFHVLPTEIVSIVPEYRGYDYIVVNDEILIVEPRTHRIVETLPEGRSAAMDRRARDCP
jgi:hypothetical protein